jgi:hypothetical protein
MTAAVAILRNWVVVTDDRKASRELAARGVILHTTLDLVRAWHESAVLGERVQGLGANDAKASVAAMTAAFLDAAGESLGITLGLALVASEETTAQGTQDVLAHLAREGHAVAAAVFGEPTELQLAVAQKGLLVLELVARGTTRHAGHPRTRGEASAVRMLARDLRELDDVLRTVHRRFRHSLPHHVPRRSRHDAESADRGRGGWVGDAALRPLGPRRRPYPGYGRGNRTGSIFLNRRCV